MPRATTPVLALILVGGVGGVGGAARTAHAREPLPQVHEVAVSIDLGVQQQNNNFAIIDGTYTFTPAGIDKNDDLPPILRRFVTHPSSVFFHFIQNGSTREAITSGRLGAQLEPLGGALYAKVEGGLGRHLTIFEEPYEFGYWFATLYGELGFRPASQLTIGAFYLNEPIFSAVQGNNLGNQADRSGGEQRFGLTTTFADPSDRLFMTLTASVHLADWHFARLSIGDTTIRGWGAQARIAYNASLNTTLQFRGGVERDHWVDSRMNDGDPTFAHYVGTSTDLQVWSLDGGVDLLFAADGGRYGFRVSLGGGWLQRPPLYLTESTAVISLGGGMQLRF